MEWQHISRGFVALLEQAVRTMDSHRGSGRKGYVTHPIGSVGLVDATRERSHLGVKLQLQAFATLPVPTRDQYQHEPSMSL